MVVVALIGFPRIGESAKGRIGEWGGATSALPADSPFRHPAVPF
jgi:hypothetical protein